MFSIEIFKKLKFMYKKWLYELVFELTSVKKLFLEKTKFILNTVGTFNA